MAVWITLMNHVISSHLLIAFYNPRLLAMPAKIKENQGVSQKSIRDFVRLSYIAGAS